MNVAVLCEFSGTVRDAFLDLGHYAESWDLLPTTSNRVGRHLQEDIKNFNPKGYDLIIAHPPCTYLCNSGVRWLKNNPERMAKVHEAHLFFMHIFMLDCPRICIENPIPHKYAALPKYTQIIQPWQFGHGETKATCLWLKGLSPLVPTDIVEGRKPKVHMASPGPDRWKVRSLTYSGIAKAMAEQWGY